MATAPTSKRDVTDGVEITTPASGHKASSLTAEYRKAHKNYVLVAGLLASWELIGINLNTKEKWGIELSSPKAVPLILFTLLVYSAYKVIIEWKQCDGDHLKTAARVDYYVAHSIGASAVTIALIQTILRIRVADVLAGQLRDYLAFVFVGAVVAFSWPDMAKSRTIWSRVKYYLGIAMFAGFPMVVIVLFIVTHKISLILPSVCAWGGALLLLVSKKLFKRLRRVPEQGDLGSFD